MRFLELSGQEYSDGEDCKTSVLRIITYLRSPSRVLFFYKTQKLQELSNVSDKYETIFKPTYVLYFSVKEGNQYNLYSVVKGNCIS